MHKCLLVESQRGALQMKQPRIITSISSKTNSGKQHTEFPFYTLTMYPCQCQRMSWLRCGAGKERGRWELEGDGSGGRACGVMRFGGLKVGYSKGLSHRCVRHPFGKINQHTCSGSHSSWWLLPSTTTSKEWGIESQKGTGRQDKTGDWQQW